MTFTDLFRFIFALAVAVATGFALRWFGVVDNLGAELPLTVAVMATIIAAIRERKP